MRTTLYIVPTVFTEPDGKQTYGFRAHDGVGSDYVDHWKAEEVDVSTTEKMTVFLRLIVERCQEGWMGDALHQNTHISVAAPNGYTFMEREFLFPDV